MINTRDKMAKGIMVGAKEKMSTELNTGADWEQSKRLVVHWRDMWAIQKRENELLKRKLEVAVEALTAIVRAKDSGCVDYKDCQCWHQIARKTIKEIEE